MIDKGWKIYKYVLYIASISILKKYEVHNNVFHKSKVDNFKKIFLEQIDSNFSISLEKTIEE